MCLILLIFIYAFVTLKLNNVYEFIFFQTTLFYTWWNIEFFDVFNKHLESI